MSQPVEQLLLPLHPPGSRDEASEVQRPARSLSPLFDRLYSRGVEKMRRRRRPPKGPDRAAFSPRTNRIKGGGARGTCAEACNRLYAEGLKSRASRVDLHGSRPLPAECTFMPSTSPRMKVSDPSMRSIAQRKRKKIEKAREADFAIRLYKEAEARRRRIDMAASKMPSGCSFSPAIKSASSRGGVGGKIATDRLYKSGLEDIQRKKKQDQIRQRKPKVKMSLSAEGADRLFKQAQEREERLEKLRIEMDKKNTFKPTLNTRAKTKKMDSSHNENASRDVNNNTNPDGPYLGEEHNDVRGLAGVDDDLEDVMLQQATDLVSPSLAAATPAKPIADDADSEGKVLCHAVAMYDYAARDPKREVNFKAGEIIACTEMDNADGWWHGRVNGAWGAFPLSYVHCVVKHAGEDYLLLPADWTLHRSSGDKEKIGTFNCKTKIVEKLDGTTDNWAESKLV